MTDRAFSDPDVLDRLRDWHDREAVIDALCEALADAHAEASDLRRDADATRRALVDKCAECAGLSMRLKHSLERERVLHERHRRRDWWGGIVRLWDWLNGGTTR